MRVGCKFTSVWRSEANSEYLRCTSMPYVMFSFTPPLVQEDAYPGGNRVCDPVPAAFHVLPRMRDQDGRIGILVQPLFGAAIVPAFLGSNGLRSYRVLVVVVVVVVTEVNVSHVAPGYELWRFLLRRRRSRGRRRGTIRHCLLVTTAVLSLQAYYAQGLQAPGEDRPGSFESWRAKDPYGLLSSSSHMMRQVKVQKQQ